MRERWRITAVVCLTCLSSSARGDAPLIHCTGTESGGEGPRQYAYRVDAATFPMTEFAVGTNDLDQDQYDNVLTPAGWNFSIEPDWMSHIRGLKTRHGECSPGPCWCLTEGKARWWTDDPAFAVEHFVFGYDHPWRSEDVGWILHTRREGPPPQSYSASESWQEDVGTGMGPVHGPCAPAMDCLSDDECEPGDYCEFLVGTCGGPGTTRPQPHGCPIDWHPVCGCDGATYANACDAATIGVSIAYGGACQKGDFNLDGRLDLGDHALLSACMSGPSGGIRPGCGLADVDSDEDVDLSDVQLFQAAFDSSAAPRIRAYSNSGCLLGSDVSPTDEYPFCDDEEQVELTVGPGVLRVLHAKATYNCCVDDIEVSLAVDGTVLRLTEEELLTMPCFCMCCYDVETTVIDLAPGAYTVVYCWQDWESHGQVCHVEAIVIPGPQPRIEGYSNSGCLPGANGSPADGYPFCGEDQIELTVGPGTLHLLHTNATYNCCVDDITISLTVDGTVLTLTEEELLAMGGCDCLCCYDVEATVVGLAPGVYAVEFCWYDYETGGQACQGDNIEIPSQQGAVESDRPRETSPSVEPTELAELVAGNSAFAFDFYQAVREGEDNLFFSPHSISLALAMTYAGARAETESQMSETMHFALGQERLHTAFNALDLELASRGEGAAGQDGEGFRLNIVNAIWGQTGYSFLSEFLDVLAENYGAGLRLLDFSIAPEASRIVINDWVSEQTEGRIEDLIPEGVITWLTRLVLTNAIYFNAAWKYPFEEEFTSEGTFHLLDGDQMTVPMMSQTRVFGYTHDDSYDAVELPYDGDELSMVILLPGAGAFEEFESSLDAQRVADILGDLGLTNVALTMPKFTYESSFSLKDTLPGMGMSNAFRPDAADFSGIDGTRALYIFDVLHKAFVSVDEAGTEAAAATAVVVGETSVPPPPVEVIVDRPFIFVIRDTATGAILFVGRVQDPCA